MARLVRTITYTGPDEWLEACIDNAFVSLKQELGEGKSITSKWRDTKAQRRALQMHDGRRAHRRKRVIAFAAPRALSVFQRLDTALTLLSNYREQHSSCHDWSLGGVPPMATDKRCATCRAVDDLEGFNA